jgi:hypothetical protein
MIESGCGKRANLSSRKALDRTVDASYNVRGSTRRSDRGNRLQGRVLTLTQRTIQLQVAACLQRRVQAVDFPSILKQTKPIYSKSVPHPYWLYLPRLPLDHSTEAFRQVGILSVQTDRTVQDLMQEALD